MRAVVQRCKSANVTVDGKICGEIGAGLMVLIGINSTDNDKTIAWMADKLANLRIFSDIDGKMNLSLLDVNADMLIVSNFTLYGDARKGLRPSYIEAAPPEISEPVYNKIIDYLKSNYKFKIETGIFGAMMDVQLINDGPVTLIIDKD